MLFSERDIDVLWFVCWCQYIQPERLSDIAAETEIQNLITLSLLKRHVKSKVLVLTAMGFSFLQTFFPTGIPILAQSYHEAAIQRRLRQSMLVLTFYRGGTDIFITSPEGLSDSLSLFLPTITRGHGINSWGNVRIAAISHLGDLICAMHYVCPGIGRLTLTDELSAFNNQTAQFQNVRRTFIFAGESYNSILAELEVSDATVDSKLVSYEEAETCSSRCICSPAMIPAQYSSRSWLCRTTASGSPGPR